MRILKLDLRAFGPFTDFELDLSGGRQGLHLIYGPNEAGKSSALRAVEQMLFGIPARSSDDFIHPYANLRLGGTIAGRNGSPVAFLRRKGNKNTLLEADNRTPLADAALSAHLGGLDRDLFVTMFGIGHQQLVQGGQEIVRGHGEVGQLLFAAGSGIADLQTVREKLESRAEDLFTRRAQVRQINQKLKSLEEAKRALRQAQLPASEWTEHDEALRNARQRRDELVAELHELERQKRRLERIVQAQPLVARRKNLRQERAKLGEVAILPDGFSEQRRETETSLRVARKQEETAAEELRRLDRERESLVAPPELLAAADRIRELPKDLGSYSKAQRDLPGLRARREQSEADARLILRQLRPDMDLAMADQLLLTGPQRVEIQNLGNRHEALVRQGEQARAQIDDLQAQFAETEQELEHQPRPRDGRLLTATVRRIQAQGDLEGQRAAALEQLRRSEEQAKVELARLGLCSCSLEELERLPVPPAESIDRYEAEFTELLQRKSSLEDRVEEATAKRREIERQIDELRLAGDVPTEEDLAAARQLRDEGWRLVLESWQDGRTDEARLAAFLARFEPETDLAAAYARAVERTDELADRLRRESNRVARRASLQANRDAIDHELARYRQQLEGVAAGQQEMGSTWRACWQPAGIPPQSPREMRVWLRKQQALTLQAQSLRAQRQEIAELERRIAACRQERDRGLEELGEQPAGAGETLATLIARSLEIADAIAAAAEQRQTLEKSIGRLSNQVKAARIAAEKAESQLARWQGRWAAALGSLGLPPASSPAAANEVVARIGDLWDRLKEARGFAERIEQIGCDSEGFRRQVEDLARQTAPELANRSVEQTAEDLYRQFQKASENRQRQEKLQQERSRYCRQQQDARRTIEELTARLETMCREAGCGRPEDLPQVERNSEAAKRLDENLASLDAQLVALAAASPLETFIAETDQLNADDLPGRIAELSQRIERLQAERDELQRRIGQEENALAGIDTGAQASEAAEVIQDLLARISGDVDQYVRFRLAAVVLRGAVERYQEKNEAPVLQRASELFRRLTLASFARLVPDFGEQGEKVLMGDRGDGSNPVPLAGMSDGTCDQVYLALRLASLEHYLEAHEAVPFIVDDILIGFDDGRSAAALEILAELSRKTQVIFFTHHEHLVSLAQEHLSTGELFVYRLPGRACPAAVHGS